MAKSVILTYFLFLTTGFFATHHLYLGRYSHALLSLISLNGFFLGFFFDFIRIPRYVQAKNVPRKINCHNSKPNLNPLVFFLQIIFGIYFYAVFSHLIPPENDFIKLLRWAKMSNGLSTWTLKLLHPIVVNATSNYGIVLALQTVGDAAGIRCKPSLLYWAANLLPFLISSERLVLRIAILVFYFQANREWVKSGVTAKKQRYIVISVRTTPLDTLKKIYKFFRPKVGFMCFLVFFYSAIMTGLFLHLGVSLPEQQHGEEVFVKYYVKDMVIDFFSSEMWSKFTNFSNLTISKFTELGWEGVMEEIDEYIVDRIERHDEIKAYKLLGVSEEAGLEDIRKVYKKKALKWHPDRKVSHYSNKEQTEVFIEYQKALKLIEKKRMERDEQKNQEEKLQFGEENSSTTNVSTANKSRIVSNKVEL